MPTCAVISCKARSEVSSVAKGGISFHRFPKKPDIRKQWIEITGRKDWIPTKSSTICSQHFNEDDFEVKNSKKKYLKNGAVPHVQVVYLVNDTKDSTLSPRKRTQKNIGNEIINKRAKVQEIVDPILTTSSTVTVMEESASQTIRDVDPVPLNSSTVLMLESVNQPIKDMDPVPTNSSVLMEECSSVAIHLTTDYVKKIQSSVPSFIDSNALTPRKRRLTRIISYKENIIKHQRNQIKRIQAQNRRLKKKIHKMADIINDLEKKFSLKEEQLNAFRGKNLQLLSSFPESQKQKTPSSPTILQESSNVEGVAKDPPGSTSLSTTSTLSTTQVPVLVKEELIEYCRLCAASDCVGELLNIQSDDGLRKLVVKMTKRLNTNIDFSQEYLPKTICSTCVKALYTAYDFVVGIDQAQITLNNKLIQKGVHQMPGNRYLDNNLDLSSMSLQQISTNEGSEANDFEWKPLQMPSTSFLLPQVVRVFSSNEVAASDFKPPLLPVSNTTVPPIQVSSNIGPAVIKTEQPPPLESSSNSPTWQDAAAKRMKYSYDLSKQVQRIDGQRKNIKILNQKIRRLQKRNVSLKNLIITLKKKILIRIHAKNLSSKTFTKELFNNMI